MNIDTNQNIHIDMNVLCISPRFKNFYTKQIVSKLNWISRYISDIRPQEIYDSRLPIYNIESFFSDTLFNYLVFLSSDPIFMI